MTWAGKSSYFFLLQQILGNRNACGWRFRFDLAFIMTRSSSLWDAINVYGIPIEGNLLTTGTPLSSPPLIDISNDSILCGVKLIAEAWDTGGACIKLACFRTGVFGQNGMERKSPVHHPKLVDTDGKYRDVVRQFIKDTYGFSGAFAECLCGSPDLYQGVPMIFMGDEYGHTKGGNNNTYCHDNYVIFYTLLMSGKSDFFRFCCPVTNECESLGLKDFPTAERLQWHGHTPDKPGQSDTSRFVAYTLIDAVKREIYMAFNAGHLPVTISLPERPGYRWEPLVDNSKPAPYDFFSGDLLDRETSIKQHAQFLDANLYPILSYSSIILLWTTAKPHTSIFTLVFMLTHLRLPLSRPPLVVDQSSFGARRLPALVDGHVLLTNRDAFFSD
ncbi:hypothetical protein Q3G72_011084 [Acer saccharum]|nr:hypothetical protein Q3G72_011084 [Acer saccharum]